MEVRSVAGTLGSMHAEKGAVCRHGRRRDNKNLLINSPAARTNVQAGGTHARGRGLTRGVKRKNQRGRARTQTDLLDFSHR